MMPGCGIPAILTWDVSGSGILALKVPNRLVRLGEEVRQEPSSFLRRENTREPPEGVLEWSDVKKVHFEKVSWFSPSTLMGPER